MSSNLDYEIGEEDQNKIVEFSKLHNKKNQIETQLKILKQHVQSLSDAQEELLINMDTPYLKIGDCFLRMDETDLEQHLSTQKDKVTEEILKLEQECEEYVNKTTELKGILYAKFGNRINLET
ncbi:prefoldin 4 like protein [Babesia gibsoni]|uniref:Prefoldin subunit 4 n=1 Tax=Babesia gibsoni TaxID=33632 RepID=A0AAD8PGI7_BABGI|nr:prefoldin 4 like protein [Babesia gibsoni]